MRLNLGSGGLPIDGFTNVDLHSPADVQGDIRELDFQDVEEVTMFHLLEHLGFREVVPTLTRVHSWMKPGAKITVEVPDMEALMANPRTSWPTDIYGCQDHEGEFHKSGFNHRMLGQALHEAGFTQIKTRTFISDNQNRPGMPCLEATGRA